MKEATRKSLEAIVTAFEQGKLGAMDARSCVYKNPEGQFCAIGCLLTEGEMEEVIGKNMNESGTSRLWDAMPEIQVRTGINKEQAFVLQSLHDNWAEATSDEEKAQTEDLFIGGIKRLLSGESTELRSGLYSYADFL